MGSRRADIAEDAGNGQVFLTPLAIAVAPQVEAQRGHVGVTEPDRQAGEEATLLARDTAAVNQDGRPAGPVCREQAPGEIKTVGSSDPGLTVCHRSNDTSSPWGERRHGDAAGQSRCLISLTGNAAEEAEAELLGQDLSRLPLDEFPGRCEAGVLDACEG